MGERMLGVFISEKPKKNEVPTPVRREFNEVVQIDHQKICITDSGYNQILVIIDHFTKLAEAMPCQTVSAEETCDHLITHWISRYDIPSGHRESLRSEPNKRVDEEIAHFSSTLKSYLPQTNGLVERQNRTLVNMLRVYCSRYMTDWDKYLPQVVGAYNSTQHSTTGISPFMILRQGESDAPNILSSRIRMEKDVALGLCERSGQETTGTKRALQEEHSASTNDAAEEV